jgi:hypothetical protein
MSGKMCSNGKYSSEGGVRGQMSFWKKEGRRNESKKRTREGNRKKYEMRIKTENN